MIEDDGIIIDKTKPKTKKPAAKPVKPAPKRKTKLKPWVRTTIKVINVIVFIINCLAAAGLLCSAYAHRISPETWGPSTLVAMTFPAWMLAIVVLFALDLAWWKRTAWVPGLAMMACVGPISEFMPLNIPHLSMDEVQKEHSFSLMTYNVFAFGDYEDEELDYNRQLAYIIKEQPDVACLQEAYFLAPNDKNKITQAQLDELHHIYPYVLTQGSNFALLSKFKAQPINLDFPAKDFASGDMAAWRLFVDNKVVNVFSVHLRSFGLTHEDKTAYSDIVRLDSVSRSDIRDARTAIFPKVKQAGIERAEQIRYLQKYLSKYGGRTAIVCGDFNDPVLCYGLDVLERENHMRQAYAEVGFGPAVTYHADDLYFRIDHILYRGNLVPWSIKRGRIGASDHYPLSATFILN